MELRVLITGVNGFVGQNLLPFLDKRLPSVSLLGIDIGPNARDERFAYRQLNLLDLAGTGSLLEAFRPTHIIHLASFSSVKFSWENPIESFKNNTTIFLNLVESVRAAGLDSRILSVGSSEEYGAVEAKNLPLRETTPLTPQSPYAVARVAQEMLSGIYAEKYSVPIIMTRSFNHFGPLQSDSFLIASLVSQFARISLGQKEPTLVVGNTAVERDFIYIDDVMSAYLTLLTTGQPGTVYNVCRGESVSIGSIVDSLENISGIKVTVSVDHALIRPSDIPVIRGDSSRLRALGWTPAHTFEQGLRKTFEYWRGVHANS